MVSEHRAAIALTQGEMAGIAPEITAKAWAVLRQFPDQCFFLLGDAKQLEHLCNSAHLATPVKSINDPAEAREVFATALPVLDLPFAKPVTAGKLDPANATGVTNAIERAVALCLGGGASAIVTNPIQKETLYAAGFKFQGHTDFLGHLVRQHGHAAHDVMMLVAGDFRAVPVTVHIALKDVPTALTATEIVAQVRIVHSALRNNFGIAGPRIAITGLNPHAGENGAMGREEISIIIPACEALRAEGLNIIGPISADTAFHPEARSTYDAVLCMYHDQALIPAKTLDFHGGVNLTLGLPFIRTSPDHGTALSLAGTGKARADSLIAAIKLAAKLSATHVAG
jgi:4-hydroxythreonine-4-phosphate dehydrogenase